MKHTTSRELFEYWNRRRAGNPVPLRADIEPFDLGRKLVDTFLIQIDGTGSSKYRFCGSNIANRYGHDLTGEDFLLAWSVEDRQQVANGLRQMLQSGHGFIAGLAAETAGGGLINYEMTVLPLRGENEIDQAIGSLVRVGGHDETNRVRDRIIAQVLRTVRILEERDKAFLQSRDITQNLPPLPQSSRFRKQYGHLAVVAGKE